MKFEKLNKDKIKVTLNTDDLTANDIDFHSFMSNSDETHSLFLDVLEKAEKDYGFSTENYNLKVETVALANGNFILTITRVLDNELNTEPIRKKLHVSRKIPVVENSSIIYKFNSFDDFCNFSLALDNTSLINYKKIAKDYILYNYQNKYYLIMSNINIKSRELKNLFSLITEFATYVSSNDTYIAKLHEIGSIVFNKKAIQTCIKYFA